MSTEEKKMEDIDLITTWELIMLVCIIGAAAVMAYGILLRGGLSGAVERACMIVIGIGFLAGMTGKVVENPLSWSCVPYLIGAYLCYNGTVFSLPCSEKEREENHE